MSTLLGPPYLVQLDPDSQAIVCLPPNLAETIKTKLFEYGYASDLMVSKPNVDGGDIATLNFGKSADVPEIQRIIDSFTYPPLPVIMGS